MMSILDRIVEKKRERIVEAKSRLPLSGLKSMISSAAPARDFAGAIRKTDRIKLIAELKKASPSKGILRGDFDVQSIAKIYNDEADAMSVLTEQDYFRGGLENISLAKSVSVRPALRKDFIIDEYQIYEARAFGADALLLIECLLEAGRAKEFMQLSESMGMAVLFEVHDMKGLESALKLDAKIIGINNRDLQAMTIDIETTFKLKSDIPAGKIIVSESGIKSRSDVLRLQSAGVDAVLVGTSLMRSADIRSKIRELMGRAGS